MKLLFAAALACLVLPLFAQQNRRSLEFDDYHRWNKIEDKQLAADGRWVAYSLVKNTEGDAHQFLWNAETEQSFDWPRGSEGKFSDDCNWLIFRLKPAFDSLKTMRRRKVKEDDLPKDTLAIFNLKTSELVKIPNVSKFSMPDKWAGWVVFQMEAEKAISAKKGGSKTGEIAAKTGSSKSRFRFFGNRKKRHAAKSKPAEKSTKKEGKENGTRLIIRELATSRQDTLPFCSEFTLAEKRPRLAAISTGDGSKLMSGAYFFDLEKRTRRPLARGKGDIKNIVLDATGEQAAFSTDFDTSKAQIRRPDLWLFHEKMDSATMILNDRAPFSLADSRQKFGSAEWLVSPHAKPVFSENGQKLYFGLAPIPVLPDTTRLPEEIVKVEVWSWTDGRIFTEQNHKLDDDRKQNFACVYRISEKIFVPLGSPDLAQIRFEPRRNVDFCVGSDLEPYLKESGFEGGAYRDLYFLNEKTGHKQLIVKHLRGAPTVSPLGNFVSWFSEADSAWFCFEAKTGLARRLTNNRQVTFFNEESDVPDYPDSHGSPGWLDDESGLLVYDKYDLWQLEPTAKTPPVCLTDGRANEKTVRYIRLDPDEKAISTSQKWMLHLLFRNDLRNRENGYMVFDPRSKQHSEYCFHTFSIDKTPLKARRSKALVWNYENFETFPDLNYSMSWERTFDESASTFQFSKANPQQAEFNWGTSELVNWTGKNGQKMTGMLFKPDDFDPKLTYPMIVNFYEKSSDDLLAHRPPVPGRSQINYPFYTSRGYLVFNPDIAYRIGYPGESALEAVVGGTEFLLAQGFVDKARIGLQGHSWGGYQIAYILTKTDLFRCAESGAPVVNMTSAYGGIRWESGLSRVFQYEHQQSRIGGSLWEKLPLFMENSPLFSLDRVKTPVLILHNDNDGAVPWQQGIEYFTGLRRLGKPSWLLNYNGEPHWPVKLQNRLDFQLRMQQFFDHFLKNQPMPCWMIRGVPALEKTMRQGFELNCETGGK